MSKRYKQRQHNKEKPVTSSEWERLIEDATLRDAYVQFASEVQRSQRLADERAKQSGLPVESVLDLRNAGRVLDQYPQLVRYLDALRDRADMTQEALSQPDITRASPTGNVRGDALLGGWAGSGLNKNNPIGVQHVRQLRDWSDHDPSVAAAKSFLCGKVSRADIAILPRDERKSYNRKAMQSLQLLLEQPNELRDEWSMSMYMYTNDYLTLGQGAITKSMTVKTRLPMALYVEDAANFKIYPAWSGDPDEPRYLYEEGSYGYAPNRKALRNDEVILEFCNPATYRYGLGPVQILADTIEADLRATATALRMVEMKPPGSVVSLPGWSQQAISKLRADYENEIAGQRELLFLGGQNPAHVFPLIFSPKENQFLEYRDYLLRIICAVFGLSAIDLNLTQDVNRATAQVQQEVSDSKGFIPLLLNHETYLNTELLADFAPKLPMGRYDLNALNLRIVFPEVSEAERMLHAEKMMSLAKDGLAGLPSFTINEILMMRGEEPVKGGNTFYVMTKDGPMPWLSYDNEYGDRQTSLVVGGVLGTQDEASGPGSDETSDDDMGNSDDGTGEPTGTQDAAGGASTPPSEMGSDAAEKHLGLLSKTSKSAEEHTGVMVAFFLDTKTANTLALSGGEPPEDLHVTLCLLGDKSEYDGNFAKLKKALAGFASESLPLSGNVSGLARFASSESSEGKVPVIALVNVKGIQQFRQALASRIQGAGYTVADDFEYTPHITLAYIDEDAAMPIDEVPDVALSFDRLWLAIGDERTDYKMGDEQKPKNWEKRYDDQSQATYPTVVRSIRDTRRPGKHWSPSSVAVREREARPFAEAVNSGGSPARSKSDWKPRW